MSNKLVAMSHVDSIDEETKDILKNIVSDDSKESDNSDNIKKDKKPEHKKTIEWETNSEDSPDSEW